MSTEVIQVQEAVTRAESVRQRLANSAWGTGTSAFVAHGVPFSFTTGPALAERVFELASFLAGEDGLTVYDLGAGTGYLTRHVVEALLAKDPSLAAACRFVATDTSERMVEVMGDVFDGLPKEARGRVDVRVEDVLSPESGVEGPSILLMSYLIDAIPPQHAVAADDGIQEVLIETFLTADAEVLDASVWPPRVLNGEALADVLQSSPESLSPGAVLQVLPFLLEGAVEGDVIPGLQDQVVLPLMNTRPAFCAVLRDLVSRLSEESLILVTDFGYSGMNVPEGFEELMTEYGATTCYAVFFEEILEAASEGGGTCCLIPGSPGGTHTLGIYKGDRTDAFVAMFSEVFEKEAFQIELDQTTNLEDTLSVEEQVRGRGLDRASYSHLANLAHLSAKHGSNALSAEYAECCDRRYGLIAAPEQLLLGDLAMGRGDVDEALRWYTRAQETAPTYGSVHLKAAEVYLERNQVDAYAEAMRAYIRVTNEPVSAHVRWLCESGQVSVPEDVRVEFAQICEDELGESM